MVSYLLLNWMRSHNNLVSLGSPRGFVEQRNMVKKNPKEQRKMNPLGDPNLLRSQARQFNFDTREHNLCHPGKLALNFQKEGSRIWCSPLHW